MLTRKTVEEKAEQRDNQGEIKNQIYSTFHQFTIITLFIATVGLIFTSDYFETKLPTKVSLNNLDSYQNPSDILNKIYEITVDDTIKVIEPSIYIDESRASIDLIVYEYFNETSEDHDEIPQYTTGLTLLQEFEYPALNYFGFNNELYSDLFTFLDETIYSLYYDEFQFGLDPKMDLGVLITWLRVKDVLSFSLMLIGVSYLSIGTWIISTSEDHYTIIKRISLIITTGTLSLILIGYITVYSLINSLFASGINGFNLAASIIIFIWSIVINIFLIV